MGSRVANRAAGRSGPEAAWAPSAGAWQARPAGIPRTVPPPSVPLCFLAAAALGLVACGGALIWASAAGARDPTADPVVTAVHLGVLATLSMAVLGAMHQFTPVITQRPLRSVRLARLTLLTWIAASWLLPIGVAAENEGVVESGGALAAVAVALLVANLSAPLSARGKGAPVAGLRLSLAGFVATACYGVLYVADRRGNWFALSGHVVLAHAVVGLFAWLGLAYVAVAEKLWPMFFLAHVPGRRLAGWAAVWAVPAGVAMLSPGLLTGPVGLAWSGAAVAGAGLGAHLFSLQAHLRHRRRAPDLHLVFVLTSAAWLLAGAGLALAAGLLEQEGGGVSASLVAAAVAAFGGWILEAIVGHAHKVVPFIAWSALRARGIEKNRSGGPLMFADLFDRRLAVGAYLVLNAALALLCAGFALSVAAVLAAAGGLLAITGAIAALNLSATPAGMMRSGDSGIPGSQAGSASGGPGAQGITRASR
jgi:hypothetical protein